MSNKKPLPADSMPSTLPPHQQPQGVATVDGQPLTISDLRGVLFDTIKGIKGKTISLDHAKVISDLSQVIINSAKVEVDFVRAMGGKAQGSGFMDKPAPLPLADSTQADAKPAVSDPQPAVSEPKPAALSGQLPAVGLKVEEVEPGVVRYQTSNEERA